MVANKPGSPGRARSKPSKPLRREGRSVSAEPVCSCAFFLLRICTRDRGCSAHPVFPAPSVFRGRDESNDSGAISAARIFLLFEIHRRRPGQAKRDPGPITTKVHVARSWSHSSVYNLHRWLWVPAFAGTTKRYLNRISSPRKNDETIRHRLTGRLLRRLQQICDQVGAIARVGHAGIGHAIARHQRLRVGEISLQRLRRPDNAAALQRR
jgi:hypothetical protein